MFILPFTIIGIEEPFTKPDRFGGDFDQFVVVDIFEGLFQAEDGRRGQADGFVGPGGAHVGQLFPAAGVDHQIVFLRVLADDYPGVNLDAGADEQNPPFFGFPP